MAMKAHTIEISLKPTAGGISRTLPTSINQVLQSEYASRYLENIGAYPTRDNVEYIQSHLGINEALVLPVWAREKILIVPGMNKKELALQDLLSENNATADESGKNGKGGRSRIGNGRKSVRSKSSRQRDKRSKKGRRNSLYTKGTTGESDNTAEDSDDDDDESDSSLAAKYTSNLFDDISGRMARKQTEKLAGRKLSWTAAASLKLVEPLLDVLNADQKLAETFKSLLKPPGFSDEDISSAIQTFTSSLADYVPRIKYDKTFKLFTKLRRLLYSRNSMRLFGLLIHFCYWNVIHPSVRAAIRTLGGVHPQYGSLFEQADMSEQIETRSAILAAQEAPSQQHKLGTGAQYQQHPQNSSSSAATGLHIATGTASHREDRESDDGSILSTDDAAAADEHELERLRAKSPHTQEMGALFEDALMDTVCFSGTDAAQRKRHRLKRNADKKQKQLDQQHLEQEARGKGLPEHQREYEKRLRGMSRNSERSINTAGSHASSRSRRSTAGSIDSSYDSVDSGFGSDDYDDGDDDGDLEEGDGGGGEGVSDVDCKDTEADEHSAGEIGQRVRSQRHVDFDMDSVTGSRQRKAGREGVAKRGGSESIEGSVDGSADGSIEGSLAGVESAASHPSSAASGATNATAESLSTSEKEQLFMQLEACIMTLTSEVGCSKMALVTGRQALVSCAHFVVDEILTTIYPWFSSLPTDFRAHKNSGSSRPTSSSSLRQQSSSLTPGGASEVEHRLECVRELNLQLRRLVHQGMADLIDPSRLYTSSMLLSTLMGPIRTRDLRVRGKAKYYITSVGTKALLGDSRSAQVRKFFENSGGLYTNLPGVVEPFNSRNTLNKTMQNERLDETNVAEEVDTGAGAHRSRHPQTQASPTQALHRQADYLNPHSNGAPFHSSYPSQGFQSGAQLPHSPLHSAFSAAPRSLLSRDRSKPTAAVNAPSPSRRLSFIPTQQYVQAPNAEALATTEGDVVDVTARALQRLNLTHSVSNGRGGSSGGGGGADYGVQITRGRTGASRGSLADTGGLLAEAGHSTGHATRAGSSSSSSRGRSSAGRSGRSGGITTSGRMIDFNNLFSNQPEAGYFPQGRPSSAALQAQAAAAETLQQAQRAHEAQLLHTQGYPDARTHHKVGTNSLALSAARPRVEDRRDPGRDPGTLGVPHTARSADLESLSQISDARSMVHNKGAKVPISMSGKAALMGMMLEKTASVYEGQIQTRMTKSRISMLRETS